MELQDWFESGEFFDYGGHRIFYVDHPAGDDSRDVLLVIHGYPTSSWDFHAIWPALTERYRVIIPDMIGFGFSAKPKDYQYRIVDQADLYEALLRDRGIDRCHVLAHDYGDSVAQELLARRLAPSQGVEASFRMRSLCLSNGGMFPDLHRARPIQKVMAGPLGPVVALLLNERRFGRSFSRVFGPQTQPTEKEIAEFWALVDHNNGRAVAPKLISYMAERRANADRWVSALRDTTVPLQLINGLLDPVSGGHVIERFRETCPSAAVVELSAVGHYPQVEAPAEFAQAALAFYQDVERSGG